MHQQMNDSSLNSGLIHVYDIYQMRVNSPIDGCGGAQCLLGNTVTPINNDRFCVEINNFSSNKFFSRTPNWPKIDNNISAIFAN